MTDPHLTVLAHAGDLPSRLECDPSELYAQGWRRFLTRPDWSVLADVCRDVKHGTSGVYRFTPKSHGGQRLFLSVATHLCHGASGVLIWHVITLHAWLPARAYLLPFPKGSAYDTRAIPAAPSPRRLPTHDE